MKNTDTEIINSHPSFRMKCICRTSSHRFEISKSGIETRTDSFCFVCASQLEALGYKTRLVG